MDSFVEKSNELDIVREFAISLLKQNTLDDLCWDIAQNIGRLLRFEDCVIYLREENELIQVAAYGIKNPEKRVIDNRITIPIGEGIVGTVAETGMAEMVTDVSRDPRYIADKFGGKSELTVPLIYQDEVIGIIDSESAELNGFTRSDLRMFQSLADICSSRIASAIVDAKEKQAQLELKRSRDELEQRVKERTAALARSVDSLESNQEQLVAAHQELEEDKAWLQGLFDTIGDGIIGTDEKLRVQTISRSAEQFLSCAKSKAIGRPISELIQVESMPRFEDVLLHNKKLNWQRDCLIDGQGNLRQAVITASPIVNEGSVSGILIVINDVTQQRYLEREAAKGQRIESLGLLAGGIAHDFNNYLQAIVSGIEGASLNADPLSKKHLELSENACNLAKQLATQLLSFSKSGTPKRELVSINKIIESAVPLVRAGTKTQIRSHLGSASRTVFANASQLEQVVGNLLINADQSMPRGGEINVHLSDCQLPNQTDRPGIRIDIVDQGCGIPEDRLEQIFEPYFSTKADGSGLGLTTSYFIAKRHGGDLRFQSAVDQGTTASLFRPLATAQPAITSESHSKSKVARSHKVLLMDDDEMVRKSVCLLLQKYGFDVVSSSDESSALSAARLAVDNDQPFDLAILDLSIRGRQTGTETMSRLKQMVPGIRGILTSGFCDNAAMKGYRDFGFQGILQKPFKANELMRAIDSAFEDA